ncbi:MAG TPA: imidazole glycerol phosphate synthase subunit HisF [Fimbriimonadaceae bacterium]|nr:imidazole glycerol phosphate synthase subunit HisF [Fimbriimonadaceae bacterium]
MRSVRLIPCLDIRDGRVVKGVQFVGLRDAGDPVELGRFYDAEGADELVFLDITASSDARAPVIDLAARVADEVFIPFAVGGGIRDLSTMREVLLAGADKVCLNSAAVAHPPLIAEGAERFGSQCIVVAIDAKRSDGKWEVWTHGGRRPTGLDVIGWAREVERRGAGEVLLTSMDQDGARTGYDLELTRAVADAIAIPTIASGGAGCGEHLVDAVRKGQADAVLLAGILHDGVTRIGPLKDELAAAGLPIRRLVRP